MRANHIPTADRIKRRIYTLENRLDGAWGRFGGGNPYRRCNGCGKAEPEISISGHGSGCTTQGLLNEIEHYKKLLEEAEPDAISP